MGLGLPIGPDGGDVHAICFGIELDVGHLRLFMDIDTKAARVLEEDGIEDLAVDLERQVALVLDDVVEAPVGELGPVDGGEAGPG